MGDLIYGIKEKVKDMGDGIKDIVVVVKVVV